MYYELNSSEFFKGNYAKIKSMIVKIKRVTTLII